LADVIFYEKPGCGTNARQKRTLEAAGHSLTVRNLLTEPWTGERLRGYFGVLPVAAWFNPAAPRIKSGEIKPGALDAPAALALLVAEPILIRRPLLEAKGEKCAGFDGPLVAFLLGNEEASAHLQGCSKPATASPCTAPDGASWRHPS